MRKNYQKIITISLLALSLSFSKNVCSQPPLFSYETYKNTNGDSLLYRFLFPDNDPTRKYPLVIFLHGSGERGNDNNAQLKWGVMNFASDENMKKYPAFVIAPQCPPNISWSNSTRGKNGEIILQNTPSKPMQLLMELINDVSKKFHVDTNRIYITGLSMGGYGTFDALERYPHFFAAAVPVCGSGDVSKAVSISHIPLWMFGGANDPSVNPNLLYDMVNALLKAGAHPGFTEYPNVGHFSWIAAYNDAMMMEWLFSQHK
jgi:predicted peptidase